MTKVLVIGLDGVGFEAINEFKLTDIQQENFGLTYSTGINLETPDIWSSLLTGTKSTGVSGFPEGSKLEANINTDDTEDVLKNIEEMDRDHPHCSGGIGNRRDELISEPWVEEYDFETVNFPIYDYTNYFDGVADYQLYWGYKYVREKQDFNALVKKLGLETKDILQRTYKAISDDNDIVLSYIHDTDIICHYAYSAQKIKGPVLKLWNIVGKQISSLKEKIDEDILVLLLSDHGSNIGTNIMGRPTKVGHTPLGFYSLNKDIEWSKKIHITDFKDIITKYLDE